MAREIVLVTIIDGDGLNVTHSKAFVDSKKADEYFVKLIKKYFPSYVEGWTQEDFDECLDDGYFQDTTHFCVYINEITLED